jgi:hypothetical protein
MSGITAGIIWLLLAIPVLCFGGLMMLEAVLYFTGRALVTEYVRTWGYGHVFAIALIAAVLLVGIGMATAHFVLDGPTNYASK